VEILHVKLEDTSLDDLAGKLPAFLLSRMSPVKQKEKHSADDKHDDNCQQDGTRYCFSS
jgi:hypothetical protein